MDLEIQKYLRVNGLNTEELASKYGVYHKAHSVHPQLKTFKYDMIDANFDEILTNECRGIILDENDNWKVIARGYNKFYNYEESRAANIDWNTAKVYEKLDGTLCLLYWNEYSNSWDIGTQGTPDACGPVGGWGFTFKELFWKTWNELGYKLPDWKESTWIFELCSSYNKIIVQHPTPRIVLHGQRRARGGHELSYPFLIRAGQEYNWEVVKAYDLSSFDAIVESCKEINPMSQEGYVVCDGTFNRVKVKSPQYVALHSMIDGMGPRRLLEIIRVNEGEEFLAYFPEFKEEYLKLKHKYTELVHTLDHLFIMNNQLTDQKEFALSIKDVPFSGALFMMRAGKVKSIRDYLANVNIKNLVEYFT